MFSQIQTYELYTIKVHDVTELTEINQSQIIEKVDNRVEGIDLKKKFKFFLDSPGIYLKSLAHLNLKKRNRVTESCPTKLGNNLDL